MAQDIRDNYSHWDQIDSTAKRPSLSHRVSSVSDVTSQVPSAGSSHRSSTVSLPSPAEDGAYRPYLKDEESDISHVRVSTPESYGVPSPVERHTRNSMTLPLQLRVGTPPTTSK